MHATAHGPQDRQPPGPASRSSRAFLALAIATLALGALAHARFGFFSDVLAGHAWGADDSYITFRYAENVARGHGPVYNPGVRVEGYSAPLHMLMLVPFLAATKEHAWAAAWAVGVLLSAAALVVLHRGARVRIGEEGALGAALAFALCPAVWLWTSSGLDAPLVVLIQLALWAALPPGGGNVALVAGLTAAATLARADGFVTAGAAVLFLMLVGRMRLAAAAAGSTTLVMLAMTAWRLAYYGDALPNTYYAKVAGSLADRVAFGAAWLPIVLAAGGLLPHALVLVARTASAMWRARAASFTTSGFEIVLAPTLLAYWLSIGGDFYRERFLIALVGLGAVAFLAMAGPGRARTATALLVLVQLAPFVLDTRFEYRAEKYDVYETVGRFLGERHPGARLAVDAAGKIPFHSRLETLDMMGLNEPHIARIEAPFRVPGHSKFDPDYVLAWRPDLIAGWMGSGRMDDMAWGLDRDRYHAAGYELRYLFNGSPQSKERNVVEVASYDEVPALADLGYTYGVLVRISTGAP